MYIPKLEEFKRLSKEGNLIPVYREILADTDTPVSAFKKIGNTDYSFLLESIEGAEKWARYSFLGANPKIIIRGKGSNVEIIEDKQKLGFKNTADPLKLIRDLMKRFKPVEIPGIPRFFGGAVGFLGYDMVKFFENLPDTSIEQIDFYNFHFMITDTILIFDNVKHKIKIVSNAYLGDDAKPESAYKKAIKRIDDIIKTLKRPTTTSKLELTEGRPLKIKSNFKKEHFKKAVEKAKSYIRAGDVIQVVLSQRLEIDSAEVNSFDIYRALRVINPSPYMFYMKLKDSYLVGASPEVLVRLEGKNIELRPIAGTRPRGKDEDEDEKLERELLRDSKERAEHIMLVDLGRNDVGRVAKTGTVDVNELMIIEKYSHVMHIVSNVRGELNDGKDAFDVLRATFPAGTVTGAPKVRAMEIIEEIEGVKRGPYAGAVGYFSFSGNMDMCIAIRTMLIKDGKIYIQVGAGIVADSRPEREYYETINKGKALIKAIEMARG